MENRMTLVGGTAALAVLLVGAVLLLPASAQTGTTLAAGSVVTAGDADARPTLSGAIAASTYCFVSLDGDTTYDAGEPIFWHRAAACTTNLQSNDVRLTPNAGKPFGSKVIVGDSDFNNPLTAFTTASVMGYYDADGSTSFTTGDSVYLPVNDADGADTLSVGDLRVTPYGTFAAGTVVAAGNPDVNLATIATGFSSAAATDVEFWDTNGDAAFNKDDVLYVDAVGGGTVGVQDVRITALGVVFENPGPGTSNPSGSVTSGASGSVTSGASGSPSSNPPVSSSPKKTPGVEVVVALAGIAAVIAVGRRKA
jgi:hypothetical protein